MSIPVCLGDGTGIKQVINLSVPINGEGVLAFISVYLRLTLNSKKLCLVYRTYSYKRL